ncbi:MAG: response regulator transcription factor [Bacteroidales bacterium]|jgi:two-component system alkaline phosphatase synthesis response regulator PhoP|nr:response regulator transcription factor [Bacteroidales bacterium]NCU36605.1 response regulator transcription factor [Candidatus Falkowbacteria bacterium]MDD2632737.1 response regulator transcription factor [Bacteroidales bacterium]MDD3131336.1 response regulator transcription factor [Bacteroidales bacterium]MDD4178248.1 response regulator transcription factor [Bacteroidales bacterium]
MKNESFKILLVDDEKDILEFLGYNLKKEGYQLSTARNGKDAIGIAIREKPHLIILDVMMPRMDGIETCIAIRNIPELSNSIIVFLTARGEDFSQIAGFEAGADDYITKPVKPKVLISRIKALLRRYKEPEIAVEEINLKNITINRQRYLIIKDDQEISLPKKEFELLLLLASTPNKVFSREEIFSNVWGNDVIVGDRTIDVHVRKIREKLGAEIITTIKGVGYKMEV